MTLPSKTLHNGTLYAHVYLGPKGKSPLQHQQYVAAASVPMTRYSVPEITAFNLLSGENEVRTVGCVIILIWVCLLWAQLVWV